jgi:hypothetical protein
MVAEPNLGPKAVDAIFCVFDQVVRPMPSHGSEHKNLA